MRDNGGRVIQKRDIVGGRTLFVLMTTLPLYAVSAFLIVADERRYALIVLCAIATQTLLGWLGGVAIVRGLLTPGLAQVSAGAAVVATFLILFFRPPALIALIALGALSGVLLAAALAQESTAIERQTGYAKR